MEMEEAELTSWPFVSSAFSLDLSHTKQHLVPGAPFLLQALVREMSGSEASDVPVKVSATLLSGSDSKVLDFQQNTNGIGQVSFSIHVPPTITELRLLVSAGSLYPAVAKLTVQAPPSRGPGFLSIEPLDLRSPRVGDTFVLSLRTVGIPVPTFSHYYYMIISRGQIMAMSREPRRALTSISILVDHHLAPSFYFVAYFYHQGLPVANSLLINIQPGDCEGKLELKVDGAKEYRNGDSMKLQLQTDSEALVALGAVDTALYAVGGRSHKPLDMRKVFEVMNSYNLGCGPGGGDDALQVFQTAGLAFSDGDRLTQTKEDLSCPKEKKSRQKRNVNFQKAISEKLGQYSSPDTKRCCQDGMTKLPMARTCEQRAARVPQPACREPFLSCCKFAEDLRRNQTRSQAGLARAQDMLQEEDLIDEDDILVRSFFPENWLWRVEPVDRSKLLTVWLPDSLTTWEIHGVSLSKSKGLCVAKPTRVRVFREFHLHLRLPISVRRFEQLELRPVLYNYLSEDVTVSVHVSPVEGLCLAGGGLLAQQVSVPAGSARPVAFSVVPTAAASMPLKVVARGSFTIGDAVSKILQIEKEGAIHREEIVYNLDPLNNLGRSLEIPGSSDPNVIPDGDFSSFVRVTASEPLETLGSEGALSPGGVASLLRLPRGCAEQTMIYLAPTLTASHYLDRTEQWSKLPPETKDHAVDLIQKGHMRIQQFRKKDGSFGAWLHRDSSTWLTAFVLKILSLAQEQIGDSPEKLQETAGWLLGQQLGDGSFHDPCPVIHRGMQGGLVGTDETVALTAFVVIALHHGLAVFQDENSQQLKKRVEASITKANSFLGQKASAGLLGAHASAITAYALTLTKASEDLAVDGERDTDDDAAGAVAAPPAIDFPAEVSDPKYDESDVPAELQVLKEPLQQPTFPFLVANQLLLVSLLEHLSHVHEPNPLHSKQVFKLLCQTFIKMGLLSSFTCSDEFSSLRLHHNRAITHLMRSAKERVRQDPCQDNSYMQKIRSREIALEAQTSRYLNEFEELAILGKGGYGRVYKVRNKLDGQHYAIKKILIKSATKTDCMKVLREVKVLAGLQHPNIVGYHTAWIEHVHVLQPQDRVPIQLPSLEVLSEHEGDRNQGGVKDNESSSSIIFAELTPEKENPFVESDVKNENNNLVSYRANLVIRSSSESESSIELQEDGFNESSLRPVVKHQLPLGHSSDVEGNFTSTEESSEDNLNLLGQTEARYHLMLHIQMQLCELSLWDWIAERNKRSRECVDEAACPYVMASVATKIFQELVEGVFYIHNMGIVHRDLKPRNIFLHGPDQQVKIGDFGLACADIIQKSADWTNRNGKGTPTHTSRVGTCLYASPEQLEGSEYDAKSDMYSLGVILLELFQPFGTEMERATVLTGVRTGQIPESLSKRCPVQAKYIQLLTGRNASQRPSALQLLQSELFQTTGNVNLTLQMKIMEQEKEIEELKKQLSLLSQDKGLKR